MSGNQQLSAAQEILLAAADLCPDAENEFSEWDLTVAVWQRNQNKFGCRGYEQLYPDHKRVMMEIMGKTKRDNPIRRGWMERSRPNHYRVTKLGLAEAQRLDRLTHPDRETRRSPSTVYDAIEPYAFHRVFEAFLKDRDEPKTWLGAAAFLGLTKYDATTLDDRIRAAEYAVKQALDWMGSENAETLRSGPVGGRAAITRERVDRLQTFISELQRRFKEQMESVRKR